MAILTCLIAISLLISIARIHAIVRHYCNAKASIHWHQLPGKLVRCELMQRHEENAEVFKLAVRYSYEIDGQSYESTIIGFYLPEWSSSRTYYADLRSTITAAHPLTVFVNPTDYRDAVLISGADNARPWLLATACLLMVVCPISGVLALYLIVLR